MEGLPHFPALMKTTKISLLLALLTSGGVTASFAQMEGEYQIQPLMTRYAETAKKITLNAGAHIFNGVDLQEADKFDGYTVDADLTVPIPYTKHWQLRLSYPFYTDGEARLTNPGQPDTGKKIDISGYGGVFDFANVQLEYQFRDESEHGYNMAAYGGVGEALRFLQTTTVDKDVYNHAGQVALLGLKADWHHGDDWRFVANLGTRYYFTSDDLNPSDSSISGDQFFLLEASFAAIYHPWKAPFFPVAELVYQGVISDYNSVLFVPEIIYAINSHLELKAGAPIGLTGDGESFGGRFQITTRF